MKIYRDKFTNDEVLSDIFPMKLINEVVWEVEGKLRTDTTAVSDEMIGGNKSAEGGDDEGGADPASVSGINIVLNHKLQEFAIPKKDYMTHIKEYMKRVVEKLKEEKPAEVEVFQKNIQLFIKDVLAHYDDYKLYCGESNNPDSMYILLKYLNEGTKDEKIFMYYFKHGLDEEKV